MKRLIIKIIRLKFFRLKIVRWSLIVYGIICLGLFVFQRDLIYKPDKAYISPDPDKLPNVREIVLTTEDKLLLEGWFVPSKNGLYVIFFNGNSGGMHVNEDFYAEIIKAKFGLLTFNYRGYGRSEGSPSELGLYKDARAAIEYIKQNTKQITPNVDKLKRPCAPQDSFGNSFNAFQALGLKSACRCTPDGLWKQHYYSQGGKRKCYEEIPVDKVRLNVIFVGRSLGSGVAVQMATEYLPLAMALISPYSSIADVAKLQYPYIPVYLLLVDRFDSFSKAIQVSSPTMIFHGDRDELIPVSQAYKLAKAIKESMLFIYKNQDHNKLDFARIMLDMRNSLLPQRKMD